MTPSVSAKINQTAVVWCIAAALLVLLGGYGIATAKEDVDDLRSQWLAVPLTPQLGGDTTVVTTGPRAFRSIAANANNGSVFPFLFAC